MSSPIPPLLFLNSATNEMGNLLLSWIGTDWILSHCDSNISQSWQITDTVKIWATWGGDSDPPDIDFVRLNELGSEYSISVVEEFDVSIPSPRLVFTICVCEDFYVEPIGTITTTYN